MFPRRPYLTINNMAVWFYGAVRLNLIVWDIQESGKILQERNEEVNVIGLENITAISKIFKKLLEKEII